MIRKAHLNLVAMHSVRHGVRGGAGLIAIFMILVCGLTIAQCVVTPLEMIERERDQFQSQLEKSGLDAQSKAEIMAQRGNMDEKINDEVNKIARKGLDFVLSPTSEQADYLTKDHPAMISVFVLMLIMFTPFLTCLAGFNQTSSDIDSKGLRFLLIRTERSNILLGRLIGTYVFSALIFLLLFAIMTVYMVAKVKVHPAGDMVTWMIGGYFRVMLFSMPYMALCAWISCAIESSFGSLTISALCSYFLVLMVKIGSSINDKVEYLQYLTPWGYKLWLFEPMGPKFFAGVAAMLGFTALFTFLGNSYFGKRDL